MNVFVCTFVLQCVLFCARKECTSKESLRRVTNLATIEHGKIGKDAPLNRFLDAIQPIVFPLNRCAKQKEKLLLKESNNESKLDLNASKIYSTI